MKIKRIIIYVFTVVSVILLVKNASRSIIYARDALIICSETIIPSLFPFFICSSILIYSGFCELLAKAFQFCMYPLFNVSPVGSSAFILGIISGYPLGAVTAGELYQNAYLSKTEAERLLAFCNNSGPLFILGAIGISMYSNIKYGIIMYIIHILSSITVGFIFRFYGRKKHISPPTKILSPERSVGEIFDVALQSGIRSIFTVCGAVLFFSVISRLFIDALHIGGVSEAILSGLLEFVTGTLKISRLHIPLADKLIMTSVIVGFAGVSIHAQVIATVARFQLSLLPYFLGKILHAVIAGVYMYIYLRFCPITVNVFSQSIGHSFAASSAIESAGAITVIILCFVVAAGLYIKTHKNRDTKF